MRLYVSIYPCMSIMVSCSATKFCSRTPNQSNSTVRVSAFFRVLLGRCHFLSIEPACIHVRISLEQRIRCLPIVNFPFLTLDRVHRAYRLLPATLIRARYFSLYPSLYKVCLHSFACVRSLNGCHKFLLPVYIIIDWKFAANFSGTGHSVNSLFVFNGILII